MITSMQMYWLLQLDSLKSLLEAAGYLGGIIILVSLFAALTTIDIAEDSFIKKCFKMAKITAIPTLIFFAINAFLPSTKRMAAIIVVPAIVNNQKVQDIGNKTLDVGNELLDLTKQYLEESIKEGKKNEGIVI